MYCVLTGHLTCQKDFSSWRKTLNHRFVVEVTVHFLALVSQFFDILAGSGIFRKRILVAAVRGHQTVQIIRFLFAIKPPNRRILCHNFTN